MYDERVEYTWECMDERGEYTRKCITREVGILEVYHERG